MSDNSNLIKRLREYSNARKGEIAELTGAAADALERQKGTLEEEYMKHYIQGRKDERAIQEGRMMQTFSPDNGMTVSLPLAPAADVVERKKGEWIEGSRNPRSWQFICSICHLTAYDPQPTRKRFYTKRCRYKFCPNCGAEMQWRG